MTSLTNRFIWIVVFIIGLFSVFSYPSSVSAGCYDVGSTPVSAGGGKTIPSCFGVATFSCMTGSTPYDIQRCCDKATECPSGTSGTAYSVDDDNVSTFCDSGDIRTALGCIGADDPVFLVNQIVSWTAGLGAGAAFFGIVYSGFLLTTAAGDTKKVAESRSWLSSSLLGLLIISTAVVLLNFIGVQFLGLNNWGFGT